MGAELKITQYLCPTQPLLLNEPLLDAYEANMAALGEPVVVEEANRLSTDAGNVSFRIPTSTRCSAFTGGDVVGVDLEYRGACSPGRNCDRGGLSEATRLPAGRLGNRTKGVSSCCALKIYHGRGQDYLLS